MIVMPITKKKGEIIMWKNILKAFPNEEDRKQIIYATVRYMLQDSAFQPVEGFTYQNTVASLNELYENVVEKNLYPKFRMTKQEYLYIILGAIMTVGDMAYAIVPQKILANSPNSSNLTLIRDTNIDKLTDGSYFKDSVDFPPFKKY